MTGIFSADEVAELITEYEIWRTHPEGPCDPDHAEFIFDFHDHQRGGGVRIDFSRVDSAAEIRADPMRLLTPHQPRVEKK
jgi:hypothetical protein